MIVLSEIWSLSKLFNLVKNPSMLLIYFLAAAQLQSYSPNNVITAAKVIIIICGGAFRALNSVKSDRLMESIWFKAWLNSREEDGAV